MTTLGVIPARKGSERFPGKHHALLLGLPLFAYTLEAARQAKEVMAGGCGEGERTGCSGDQQ